jgi:hypothetical protein
LDSKTGKEFFIFADQVSSTEHGCSFKFSLIQLVFLLRVTVSNLIKSIRLQVGFWLAASSRTGTQQIQNRGQDLHETALALLIGPSNSSNDHDDCPRVGANVGVLCPATSIGGTCQRVDGGGSPDPELEGMHEDTRHKIYIGSGSQSSVPYVVFGIVLCPALGCCSPEGLGIFG